MEKSLRRKLYIIIFEADTPLGKLFDLVLLFLIALSVLAVMLESIADVREHYGHALELTEWVLTVIFTLEYILRIYVTRRSFRYIFSFYGIIDLLSLLPSYLSMVFVGTHSLMVIRGLRLLRIFRILKFTRYSSESQVLIHAIVASRHKIFVFLFVVLNIIVIMGTLMYLVEGEEHGFSSIPHSIYWAIVTVTTVGYGDIAPQTDFGKLLASISMLIGYAILAVPTGIVSHEISKHSQNSLNTRVCGECFTEGHEDDSNYCRHCGAALMGKD